jgi:hypothetical protein
VDPRAKSTGHRKKTADKWNQQRRLADLLGSSLTTRGNPSVASEPKSVGMGAPVGVPDASVTNLLQSPRPCTVPRPLRGPNAGSLRRLGARAAAAQLATHALRTSNESPGFRIARNLDLAVLALGLAVFLAADLPIGGWFAGAGAWILQRVIRDYVTRRAARSDDPRTLVGLLAGSMIGRGWIVAGIIVAVGATDSHAGLGAAVLFLAVFTVYFTTNLILRPFEQEQAPKR